MISILHLASDEKFIDAASYLFDKAFPGQNCFLIPKSRFNRSLVYVKSTKDIRVIHYFNNKRLLLYLLKETERYDCVILHGITEMNSTVFMQARSKEKFVGILWGAELYVPENFPDRPLIGEMTSAISFPAQKTLNGRIREILRRVVFGAQFSNSEAIREAAGNLFYFSVPYEEEYINFRERNVIPRHCKYIPFTYYPLEYIMKGNLNTVINGNDIFIGNSALPFSNHLEAFSLLKKFKIGTRKVVVPLSYGNPGYADVIEKAGYEQFDTNFRPIRRFLPMDEYLRDIQSCGVVIMNHYRQQALGILLALIYMGSKVYLNESNTAFQYFKRIGIKVYSIEKEFHPGNQVALENLSEEEICLNRKIIEANNNEDFLTQSLREAFFKTMKFDHLTE